MKKTEREKLIEVSFNTVKAELPRLIKEEFQSIAWDRVRKVIDGMCKEIEKIESELDIVIEHYGFVPLEPRLRRILYEVKSRK